MSEVVNNHTYVFCVCICVEVSRITIVPQPICFYFNVPFLLVSRMHPQLLILYISFQWVCKVWCIHPRASPSAQPSRGRDVVVYVFNINQLSLPTPFYAVLLSFSVFMALSTVFHSINSPNNSPLSHFVLPVLVLLYWSFQLYISFFIVSLSPDIILCGWLDLKHQLTN